MSAKDDNSADRANLYELEKKLNFKIMDARDVAVAYLREYVQEMDTKSQLPGAIEKIKVIENQFGQIISKLSHWRKRMECFIDLKKYGWLHKDEEDELNALKVFGADWEYYTVIFTRIGFMRKRLAHLRKKKAEAGKLKIHEQAELTFLRNLGADSIEFSVAKFDDGTVSADRKREADHCPAGGRIGYDLDSLESCSDCKVRVICSQKAVEIEEAFKR